MTNGVPANPGWSSGIDADNGTRVLVGIVPQTAKRKIRVFLVSRFSLSRHALRAHLDPDDAIETVGDAETLQACLAEAAALSPDIVVVETYGRADEDLDAVMAVRNKCPETRVLLLTGDADTESCLRALRFGVSGYLLVSVAPQELCTAVRAVAGGEIVVHQTLTQALVGRLVSDQQLRVKTAALTPREMEIIRGLGEGLSDKQIARRLSLAESTIKIHLHGLYQKLGLRNRAQTVAYAYANGLLRGRHS